MEGRIEHMKEALNEAEHALQQGEIPVGCVFVDTTTNEIIGRGSNQTNETRNGTRHAELVAIDKIFLERSPATVDFSKIELYVTCEPCIMCAAALGRIGISKVYFGCKNERFGGNGSILNVHQEDSLSDLSPYPIETGLLESEAIEIFQVRLPLPPTFDNNIALFRNFTHLKIEEPPNTRDEEKNNSSNSYLKIEVGIPTSIL